MKILFSKDKILQSSLSTYDDYCVGYSGKGGYITALVMGIGSFLKKFSHSGSMVLDSIMAYDQAETIDAYIGQINMITVSSFCGPQGLIWGYDIAQEKNPTLSSFLTENESKNFGGINIHNGRDLRRAAKMLFGTKEKRRYPLLPGTHVPCAGRFKSIEGPAHLYSAVAIGIPADRNKNACVFMEDVGELSGKSSKNLAKTKRKILSDAIESVLTIGKAHKIDYKDIIIDLVDKKIKNNEVGCALVAIPYFHLAKKAFDENV